MGDKIKCFEDMESWRRAIDFSVHVYTITKKFPKEEIYGITNQLRRASSSVSANIAEGFGRQGKKEKIQFYTIAYGSLLESKSFLYLSHKLDYISKKILDRMLEIITVLQKMINSSLRVLRTT